MTNPGAPHGGWLEAKLRMMRLEGGARGGYMDLPIGSLMMRRHW
jgi:hypothetical protein